MGTRILVNAAGDEAALWDSVSAWAFGPVFQCDNAAEVAQEFIDSLPEDPRRYKDRELWDRVEAFHKERT